MQHNSGGSSGHRSQEVTKGTPYLSLVAYMDLDVLRNAINLTGSIDQLITHSLTHSLTQLIQLLACSLIHPPTHSLTQPLTQPLSSLNHSTAIHLRNKLISDK